MTTPPHTHSHTHTHTHTHIHISTLTHACTVMNTHPHTHSHTHTHTHTHRHTACACGYEHLSKNMEERRGELGQARDMLVTNVLYGKSPISPVRILMNPLDSQSSISLLCETAATTEIYKNTFNKYF